MSGAPASFSLNSAASGRCPHVVFHNVFGLATVAELLKYVTVRQRDFAPAQVRDREDGRQRLDPSVRTCHRLNDLGAFYPLLRQRLSKIAADALPRLGLSESRVEASEFEMCAYGDGGHFGIHVDTFMRLAEVRVLSCVYYFAATPRRFGGGALRLYGLPSLSTTNEESVDIPPETDSLVVFPSWLWHEVLPVTMPTQDWCDRRFTINCWLYRAASAIATNAE